MRAQRRAREPGAAPEIEHATEAYSVGGNSLAQHGGRGIIQVFQRAIEARRILIKQRPHIAVQRRRRGIGRAEARKMQRGAVAILRVGSQRPRERGSRAFAIPQGLACLAEREPGRGEAGAKFRSLREQVRRRRKIAIGRIAARNVIAPIGDQVARADKEWNGHACLE